MGVVTRAQTKVLDGRTGQAATANAATANALAAENMCLRHIRHNPCTLDDVETNTRGLTLCSEKRYPIPETRGDAEEHKEVVGLKKVMRPSEPLFFQGFGLGVARQAAVISATAGVWMLTNTKYTLRQ